MTGPRRTPPSAQPRASLAPSPRRRASDRILAGLALLIVGGFVGVGAMNLIQGSSPTSSAAASAAPSDGADAGATDAPAESIGPEESAAPGSSILEARLPATIDGVTMTVESAVDATSLSSGPDGRALNAAVVHLGKLASDLEIAIAYDDAGSLDLTMLAFRVDGVSGPEIRDAVLSAWLAVGTPGVTTTSLQWSGADVTRISYGDDGADEYVLTLGDSVFVLETADAATAQSAAAALVTSAGVPGASPGP